MTLFLPSCCNPATVLYQPYPSPPARLVEHRLVDGWTANLAVHPVAFSTLFQIQIPVPQPCSRLGQALLLPCCRPVLALPCSGPTLVTALSQCCCGIATVPTLTISLMLQCCPYLAAFRFQPYHSHITRHWIACQSHVSALADGLAPLLRPC